VTSPLPMYTGKSDMGVDAELEDNNAGYNYDFNIINLTRGKVSDKGYGPKTTANNLLTLGDKELKFKDNKVTFSSGMSCALSPGQYSLIFLSKHENYDDQAVTDYLSSSPDVCAYPIVSALLIAKSHRPAIANTTVLLNAHV